MSCFELISIYLEIEDASQFAFLGKGFGGNHALGTKAWFPPIKSFVYPLTPPWMTPFSILSWKNGKAMIMGAMAAMMTANWIR